MRNVRELPGRTASTRRCRKAWLACGASLVLASMAAAQDRLWTAAGDKPGDWLGWTVSVIGDMNGDGVLDVASAMPYVHRVGVLRVFDGRTGAKLFDVDPNHAGVLNSRRFGDVNLDGVEDFFIRTRATTKSVRVYSGSDQKLLYSVDSDALPIVVGDVDHDGRPDFATAAFPSAPALPEVQVRSGKDGHLLLTLAPNGRTSRFCSAWATTGDWNHDGTPDLEVGDSAGGAAGFGTVYVLSLKDGAILANVDGQIAGARYGAQLYTIGDIDHDGVVDLAVGAPREDVGTLSDAGVVHFVSGATLKEISTFYGDETDERLEITAVVGDVDGDGFQDFVVQPANCYMMADEPVWIRSGRTFGKLYSEQPEYLVDAVCVGGGADFDGDGIDDIVSGRTGLYLPGSLAIDRGGRVFLTAYPKYKSNAGGNMQQPTLDDLFSFHAADFALNSMVALELVEVDGVATSQVLAVGATNAIGEWDTTQLFVPRDSSPHTYGCRATGFDSNGQPIATVTEYFGYR